MDKVLTFIRSSLFLKIIIGVFILQGLFFALAVNPSYVDVHDSGKETRGGGVVPDGNRHKGAIYYFASQPLLSGPTITNMETDDLWMGELERFPSYLYYYVMSFPVRIAVSLGATDATSTTLVRLVGLAFGVCALWVFRSIVRELKAGRAVTNLATAGLALTGSFAWLSPAENYDVFAMMLFFLFLLASLRLFSQRDATQLYWMVVWFCLGSIAKYTYIPFMGLAGLAAVGLFIRQDGWRASLASVQQHYKDRIKKMSGWVLSGAVLLLLVAGGLFAERVGGNLVQYRSFNPTCSKIHSHEACMSFGVYERNYERKAGIADGTAWTEPFEPVAYGKLWLERYYTSMYAYQGHIWIYTFWKYMFIGMQIVLVMVVGLLAYALLRRARILHNPQQYFVMGIAAVMIVAQVVFNARAFIEFAGEPYAHQGRYLLAAIGFVYVLFLLIIAAAVRAMSTKWRQRVLPVLLAVGLIAILTNSALPSFFVHATSPEWYSPIARQILPEWITHE